MVCGDTFYWQSKKYAPATCEHAISDRLDIWHEAKDKNLQSCCWHRSSLSGERDEYLPDPFVYSGIDYCPALHPASERTRGRDSGFRLAVYPAGCGRCAEQQL